MTSIHTRRSYVYTPHNITLTAHLLRDVYVGASLRYYKYNVAPTLVSLDLQAMLGSFQFYL